MHYYNKSLGSLIVVFFLTSMFITASNTNDANSATQVFPILEEIAHIENTGGDTFQSIIEDDLLIVIDMVGGLKFYNITNPEEPLLLGSFYDGGMPHDIQKVGNLLYLADYNQGLEIYNITNPATPEKLGAIVDDGEIGGVFVRDNCAFVSEWHPSTGDCSMKVINVSNPENPEEIVEYTDGDNQFNRFYVEEDICYATCLESGFKILNVSNLNAITEIAHYDALGETNSIHKVDDLVFLTDTYGLVVLNISELISPKLLGNYITEKITFRIAVNEELAYISVYQTGVEILNISDVQNITKIAEYGAELIVDVKVYEDLIFLTMHSDGLMILKIKWEYTNDLPISIITIILMLPILVINKKNKKN